MKRITLIHLPVEKNINGIFHLESSLDNAESFCHYAIEYT